MVPALKIAFAALIIAAGGLVGAAIGGAFNKEEVIDAVDKTDTKIKKQKITEPVWYPLSEEQNFNTEFSSDNTIGKEYGHLLVGTYGTTEKTNESWWNRKFKIYEEDKKSSLTNLSDDFGSGKVTEPFRNNSDQLQTTLNKVCHSVYKKTKDDITSTNTDSKSKLRDNLWKYCSPLGVKPVYLNHPTQGETNYGNDKIGKTKASDLLSTKENVNNLLWDLKQEEFFKLENITEKFFKKLHDQNKNKPKEKNLFKNRCKEAYGKVNTTNSETEELPVPDSVIKYCSIKLMSNN